MKKYQKGQGVVEYAGGLVLATILVAALLTFSSVLTGLISTLNTFVGGLSG